jgi:hypothetical protein
MLYVAKLPQFVAWRAINASNPFWEWKIFAGLRKVNWAVSLVFRRDFRAVMGEFSSGDLCGFLFQQNPIGLDFDLVRSGS